ncbi:restriction endonuclease [Amycolatopsis sp. NPDC049253]|uniref:restriction endonuclease n=1 Tax=Amycolatopsis sp. NPDC049253 TaxID=3155274 RepID=UPI003445509C
MSGPDLRRFGGTCFTVHGANVAAVVTTSTFTKQARECAAHHGIRLFDAPAPAAWAKPHRSGAVALSPDKFGPQTPRAEAADLARIRRSCRRAQW